MAVHSITGRKMHEVVVVMTDGKNTNTYSGKDAA